MSVICTNIMMRVVVVKVAVDRSRRIACRRFAGLTCRRSKKRRQFICLRAAISALAAIVCALSAPPFYACKTMFVRPRIGRRQQHCPRLVRENARRVRRRRRGARRKSLQHLSVSARCRGRCFRWSGRERSQLHLLVSARCRGRRCRRGARGKSVVHMSVFTYRRGMCLSGAAQGVAAFVSSLFPFSR